MTDFFISYTGVDRSWAEWIAWQVEEAGYSTVLQAWDFRPGSNFVLNMQRAATEAERTIVVLSPSFLAATYTQPEWAAALARDPTSERGTLLPVRVQPCDLTGLWRAVTYIDLVGADEETARELLRSGVNPGRARPSVSPRFPGSTSRSGSAVADRPQFPGALPEVWNVPHARNVNFTGREALLAELHLVFQSAVTAPPVQALTGLGGVGKTQLAVEYAYRHAGDYHQVWWLRAEEPVTLADDYSALARFMDLPEGTRADQPSAIAAVKRSLSRQARWLLIFDNAQETAAVEPYLPGGEGHVLITSRNPAWRSLGMPLSVPMLPRAESVAFLLRRTGENEPEAAARLADALGDLPLALEQAGAYIDETGITIAGYIGRFRRRRAELLRRTSHSTAYPATVFTTWALSFAAASDQSPAAAALLNLCAFLGPDPIPRALFEEHGQLLPDVLQAAAEQHYFDEAIGALRRFSLVDVAGDGFSVHRLVQAVTRDRLSPVEARAFTALAVRLLDAAFQWDEYDAQNSVHCAVLLPHALVAAERALATDETREPLSHLLNQLALFLRGRAEYNAARNLLQYALDISMATLGSMHAEVGTIRNNLGTILQSLGELLGAKAQFEQALSISIAAYGNAHAEVATCHNNLGLVLLALGAISLAREHIEQALVISISALEPDHREVAMNYNNLGGVLQELGDVAGARLQYEQALAISEAALGPNHPDVGTCRNNLGRVFRTLGDLDEARAQYESALAINMAAFGPRHPNVAICLVNLGSLLRTMGEFSSAQAHFEQALAIDEAIYGTEHPEIAADRNNLGLLLHDLGDLAGARLQYEQALAISEATLGPNHPTLSIRHNNLGGVLHALGDLTGARLQYEQALAISEMAFGPYHPEVAVRRNNLGSVLHALGDLAGARAQLEEALVISEATFGLDHSQTQTVRSNLIALDDPLTA